MYVSVCWFLQMCFQSKREVLFFFSLSLSEFVSTDPDDMIRKKLNDATKGTKKAKRKSNDLVKSIPIRTSQIKRTVCVKGCLFAREPN